MQRDHLGLKCLFLTPKKCETSVIDDNHKPKFMKSLKFSGSDRTFAFLALN